MAYTDIDNPELYFQTKLYTGNGGTQSITLDGSENMRPDWVWIKPRNGSDGHVLIDSVRGALKRLRSEGTNAEDTLSNSLTSFDNNGFTLGNAGEVNSSSYNLVSWNWAAGTSFSNDASATSVGSVDSTGSINTTAGFSIISWTSLASGSNYTIAHGLGAVPAVIIMKGRHEANSWQVYHHKNTSAPETDYLDLSTTDATADYPVWNDTAPTSSVFSLGTWSGFDDGGTMIAYCFAEKKGYSKFGSYVGNANADYGTFVYTGFKPAWLLIKRSDGGTDNWNLYDNKRLGYNTNYSFLIPNETNAENTTTSTANLDILSNGFKIRGSTGHTNTSGGTYIYMAFAESPFVSSKGIPTTAR